MEPERSASETSSPVPASTSSSSLPPVSRVREKRSCSAFEQRGNAGLLGAPARIGLAQKLDDARRGDEPGKASSRPMQGAEEARHSASPGAAHSRGPRCPGSMPSEARKAHGQPMVGEHLERPSFFLGRVAVAGAARSLDDLDDVAGTPFGWICAVNALSEFLGHPLRARAPVSKMLGQGQRLKAARSPACCIA